MTNLYRIPLILVVLMLLTGLPGSLWFQAKLRANDKKAPDMRYAFLIEGVKSNVGENAYFVRWKKFFKARETSKVLLLYLNKTRAMIIPRGKVESAFGLERRPREVSVAWLFGVSLPSWHHACMTGISGSGTSSWLPR